MWFEKLQIKSIPNGQQSLWGRCEVEEKSRRNLKLLEHTLLFMEGVYI